MKAAEINHSNVALFVDQDKSLGDHGDEEGEIADAEDKKQYDISKIQEWPGFNVKLDDAFLHSFNDETERYRVRFSLFLHDYLSYILPNNLHDCNVVYFLNYKDLKSICFNRQQIEK